MGNTKTKEEKDNTPKKEKKQNIEKEEEERKASVTITPWSNEERNARFSEIKVEKDDVFVSTIFNITIQGKEQKLDEDSTTTADATPGTDEVKAVRAVIFKHNSPMMEEVASIHSVVDKTGDEKTVDYITLKLELEITKNLVIYTCHQYNGSKWTKTEIEQKVGRSTVEVDVYDFTTETIFFTLRYMCEEVIVPSGGFEFKNDFCTHQRITFPEGAVERNMKITINTMSIEGECKRKRLREEMGSDTSISSLSDIVYVHHSQPFKKKVKLRLKLDPLFNDNQSSETFLFHCDDSGCLRILKDVKMRKVPEEEVGGDNDIYEVEVDTFSGIGGFHGDPRQDHTRTLSNTYGLGRDQCRILVFLYKEDNDLQLWSDIVPEKKWKRRERELQKREGLIFLRNTVSPSVPVKNFGRLRITVLHHGRMLTAPEVPSNSTFMYYDRNAREIYNHFPVVPNKGITSEKGIIQYEMDTTPKRLLHTAYINAELYLVGLQQTVPVRQERQPTQRPKTQLQPDRQISRQPGVRRTSQADDAINDFFSEQSLFFLAQEIPTTKVWELMLQLGLRMNQIENIRSANQSDNKYKITLILYWNNENKNPPNSKLAILCGALKEVELTPVAEVLESVYNEHRSLKKGDFSNI